MNVRLSNQRISIFGDKAKLNADGIVQVQYGGDRGSVNYLPITEGWNYVVRMYQPRKQVVDGSWKFPDAQPGR